MGYVMVPVPEEHVEEAMAMILRITRMARVEPWTAEAAEAAFLGLDEAGRAVLSAVARGTLKGSQVAASDVADSIELSQREVLGIVRELGEKVAEDGHPAPVSVVNASEKLPNGRVREQRTLVMEPDLAEMFRAAERAEAEAAPHPLLRGPA